MKSENNIASHNAFQETIRCFPPQAELVFDLAQGFVVFGDNYDPAVTPQVFRIMAKYSYGRKTVRESTTVDLKPYLNSRPVPEPGIGKLKEIKESIDKVGRAIQELSRANK